MKVYLIFLIPSQEIENLQTIKGEIVKYLGVRMISDIAENLPILGLNSELTTEDETKICNIVESISKTGTIIITDKINSLGSNIIEHI